jgi:hypothetical protein
MTIAASSNCCNPTTPSNCCVGRTDWPDTLNVHTESPGADFVITKTSNFCCGLSAVCYELPPDFAVPGALVFCVEGIMRVNQFGTCANFSTNYGTVLSCDPFHSYGSFSFGSVEITE